MEQEIKEKRFDNFDDTEDWQKNIKATAIAYGKKFMEARENHWQLPWFFISGQPGCGKTHICTALCGAFLKKGIPVRYMQWVNDSRRLKSIVTERGYDEEISEYVDVDVLYIDDLLKQSSKKNGIQATDADGRLLFEILNQRLLKRKPTIISTEWYLATELVNYDDGIFSRVYEQADFGTFVLTIKREEGRNQRIKGRKNAGHV